MNREIIVPWEWQEKLDFVPANKITSGESVLYCAGQVSLDGDGALLYAGNMEAQLNQALDNLEVVLEQAGAKLSDVVRLNYYTTDVSEFYKANHIVGERLKKGNCRPVSTLLGVASLFHPDIVIEIEATAVF